MAGGSLIWNPGKLGIIGSWHLNGPILPIEFSRISKDGRLTLVIDATHGEQLSVRYSQSSFADLDSAIANLQEREETARRRIGFVDLVRGRGHSDVYPAGLDRVQVWARANQFEAVIWTDLPPNFAEVWNEAFTPERGEAYLRGLSLDIKRRAREYIRNAPSEVQTRLRVRHQDSKWVRAPRRIDS